MDKLTMAHDWYLKHAGGASGHMDLEVDLAWQYVDKMQAEADERLNADVEATDASEWQPDWSRAPEWAVAWAMDMSGECYWHSGSEQPKIKHHIFESSGDGHTFEASSFSYKGDWKDSLRKRPEGK